MDKIISFNKKSFTLLLSLTIIGILGMVYMYFWGLRDTYFNYFFTGLAQILTFGLGGFIAARNWHHLGRESNIAKSLLFLSISCYLFALAMVIWLYFNVSGVEVPYPSIADFVFVLMGPTLTLTVAYLLKSYETQITKKHWLIALVVFLVFMVAFLKFVIDPEISAEDGFLANFFNIAYGISDSLWTGAIFASLFIVGGKLFRGYAVILIGLFFLIVGDLVFTARVAEEIYWNGDIADIIYMISAFFLGYAAITLKQGVSSQSSSSTIPNTPTPSPIQSSQPPVMPRV